MNKLVTIAIASYNNALYIERCVDSVLNQTYRNLEILIVDDGSKDDSIDRIEKYQSDKRVRIETKENGGLSSVRQLCLDLAKGEYISFIDADDYLVPTYVERMLNKLLLDGSDICLCSTRFEDENGCYNAKESNQFLCKDTDNPVKITIESLSDPNERLFSLFFLSDSWNKMYRVEYLQACGVSFNMPKGLNGTDLVFNRRLYIHCPIYSRIKTEEYVHVIYSRSAVHRKNKDLLSTAMIACDNLLSDSKTLKKERQLKKRIAVFYYGDLFFAFKDIYMEVQSQKIFKESVKTMLRRHDEFVLTSNIRMPKECKSYMLKSFDFLIRKMQLALPLYFKVCNCLFHW